MATRDNHAICSNHVYVRYAHVTESTSALGLSHFVSMLHKQAGLRHWALSHCPGCWYVTVSVCADQALLWTATSLVRQLAMSLHVLGVVARGGAEVHDHSPPRGGGAGDQRAVQLGGHCTLRPAGGHRVHPVTDRVRLLLLARRR